ncbi:MAG: alpha-1,4-glucan--maltose-1-phosphate maltosyltransferase [Luteibaculaceae bacterium]
MQKTAERVIIERVTPQIDNGEFYIKALVNENIRVEADIFADGHDVVSAHILFKHEKDKKWQENKLVPLGNDHWAGSFTVEKVGLHHYTIEAWVDYAKTWQYGLRKKVEAGQAVKTEILEGIPFLEEAMKLASTNDKKQIKAWLTIFKNESFYEEAIKVGISKGLDDIFTQYPAKTFASRYTQELQVFVDRKKAGFSSWYEFFPRSASRIPGQHGTFKDCEKLLPRVAALGFDTLYFPPVHPIGEKNRKGKNNATDSQPGEPGSPWAIGSHLGGHKDLHPELGTLADFKHLIAEAKKHGIEIAMDFALQAAPDHPWVKEHPNWFKQRPDGTIQYAENPPKKYQDIYPIYFESEDRTKLWDELLSCALYWVQQGIEIFRVDNPHTKPFHFWQWLIAEVKKVNPNVLFLSEAFTRPRIMHRLAKIGFTQSYSYFTWRNNKQELTEYLTEICSYPDRQYFRPNFWPNTPDINPWNLQQPDEPLYILRYFLAATMSSNYGMYGPVYEFMQHQAYPGKEEYLNSEKYEIKHWDWNHITKITEVIKLVNKARKENEALQNTYNASFCTVHNENIIAYLKAEPNASNYILCVANMNSKLTEAGMIQVPLHKIGLSNDAEYTVLDLVTGASYRWKGEWNFVQLNPNAIPFHLFKIIL